MGKIGANIAVESWLFELRNSTVPRVGRFGTLHMDWTS